MPTRPFSVAVVVALLAVLPTGPRLAFGEPVQPLDPADLLPPPGEIHEEFEHQAQHDHVLEEAGVVRVFRFYTRGAPEVPTDEHASILLVVAQCESPQHAGADFRETVVSWTRMGYRISSLDGILGDEAYVGEMTFFAGTDHTKQGVLLQFRLGSGHATVQWTDDPDDPILEARGGSPFQDDPSSVDGSASTRARRPSCSGRLRGVRIDERPVGSGAGHQQRQEGVPMKGLPWMTGASLRVAVGAGAFFALALATHPPWYALAQGTQPTSLSTPSTTTPTATPLPLTEADVAALVAPSVVRVATASGSASGVKVEQGVLTSGHVTAGEDQIEVIRSDGTRHEARVVRSDSLYDLALLATDLDLPRLESEAARRHRPGDAVLAIGYPFAPALTGPPTVSRGVLSAVREAEGVVYVQTDAAMDFGSSGSAIVDMRGKLIGVAAGGLGLSGGLNLGVATESIQDFLNGVPLVGPDGAEPDDTLEQARPLQIDTQPERRTLHIPGDVDWVSLSLAGDERVAVFTESSHCDTYLQLYDSDGTLLAEDDDGGENGGSRIAFTALEAGTYYARVSHFEALGVCRSYDVAAQSILGPGGARSA